ncbi:MAG: PSD1 and planctomycete cytochrome C domain-containing protein [Planctomycetota bacterium]
MIFAVLLGFLNLDDSTTHASDAKSIDFNRDVRPILSDNCFFCHGPDETTREAGLRLDDRDEAIDFAAIVPGEPDESEIVARIYEDDPDWVMPPPNAHKTLTPEQKNILTEWIRQGGDYQEHWSFTSIRRPDPLPAPPPFDSLYHQAYDTGESTIDQFVRQRLAEHDASLSPPADPVRLLRRLHLDLVGLPPTWEDVDAFVLAYQSDPDEAIQNVIERLLDSPHHGERMASFWLDVARYADTVGFHGDQNQNVFPYRDWVVRAFNDNMPFDEFTIKQLAGDLLPQPSTDDLIATGFNRLNMMTREGGAQPKEYLAKYLADRVRTVGMAWLGLTTGCAECHDHKFDPFTQKDFYALGAYFADLEQWGVYSDYGYTPNPDLKRFTNDYPFPPELELVSQPLLREQLDLRQRLIDAAESAKPDALHDFAEDVRNFTQHHPSGWSPVKTSIDDQIVGKVPKGAKRYRIADTLNQSRSLRLSIDTRPNESPRNLIVSLIATHQTDAAAKVVERTIAVERAVANRFLPAFRSGRIVHDVSRRWVTPATDASGHAVKQRKHQYLIDDVDSPGVPNRIVLELAKPIELKQDETLWLQIEGIDDREVTCEASPFKWLRPFDNRTGKALAEANPIDDELKLAYVTTHRRSLAGASDLLTQIDKYRQCRDGKTFSQVVNAVEPLTVRVLPRGNWQDDSGPIVSPATPEFLGQFDQPLPSTESVKGEQAEAESTAKPRQTRLDLARWLVHPRNPLTPRVVANRLWKQFFGEGLTIAADDLGAQGDLPSHPEILDYLATELVDSGWDLRHVIRLILKSDVYQQDSRFVPSLQIIDPENRLLAFHPPRRLEAEIIRDHALSVSGLLNLEIGGPAVKPYQPVGYYSNLQFPNRVYQSTDDDDQYRRGLYMHWQRTFMHPMLANFDAPSREDCVAIRAKANTPQQALTLLNDPTFIEAAGEFAFNAMQQSGDDRDRLRWMIRRALQRDADESELTRLQDFLNRQRNAYQVATDDVERLAQIGLAGLRRQWSAIALANETHVDTQTRWAAWTSTARVLLNLHETITRY